VQLTTCTEVQVSIRSPLEVIVSGESWSQEEVRHFALSLPETHEHSHFGRPDIRVRNKIFVTFPEDGRTANLKVTPLGLDLLLRLDREAYRDVWGGRWVGVELARVASGALRELVLDAYCLAAPKRLAAGVRGVR
jgi:hypothetical protein